MTTWSIAGNKDAVNINGLPSGVDNDLGTIRAAGTGSTSALWNIDPVSLGNTRFVTVVSGVGGATGCLGAGTFNGGDQVIQRVTTDIAGVGNSGLLYGSSNAANKTYSINQKRKTSTFYYKTAIRANRWNEYSGVFSPAVTVGAAGAWGLTTDTDISSVMATTSSGDLAASPTAAQPGRLTFTAGAPNPSGKYYAAKTLF